MAFTTIPDSILAVGKAIKRELFKTYLADNITDLNTRLSLLEGSSNKIVIFSGKVSNATTASTLMGLAFHRVQSSFTLTDAKVAIFEKGSLTGTLSVDIQKSSSLDFTSSASIFTTEPSIAMSGASDYDESNNAVFDAGNADVVEGDYLRLDVTSMPSGGVLANFVFYLIGEAS